MKVKTQSVALPVFGFSLQHDAILGECIRSHGTCPFGCAKDGAPNCYYHATRHECQPARMRAMAEHIEACASRC